MSVVHQTVCTTLKMVFCQDNNLQPVCWILCSRYPYEK